MTARPATREKALEVVRHVANGAFTVEAIELAGIPREAFYLALATDADVEAAYARAQEGRAEEYVEEAVRIADEDPDPQRARNRIQVRQWVAERYKRRKFGQSLDVSVSQRVELGAALADARARLRPISDQRDVIDAQVIEDKREALPGPTDMQSVAAELAQLLE